MTSNENDSQVVVNYSTSTPSQILTSKEKFDLVTNKLITRHIFKMNLQTIEHITQAKLRTSDRNAIYMSNAVTSSKSIQKKKR